MFLPVGDEPNDRTHTPWVNYALIAANVVAFLAARAGRNEVEYQTFVETWGSVPAAPSLTTMFTSMFMHANWTHLGGNMLFLWIYGDNVEARLGRVGYLAAYLATGLVGSLAYVLMKSDSPMPGIGASGAISGVMGLYVVAFPRNRVKIFYWIYWYAGVWLIPAWLVILVWFVLIDNVLPTLASIETGVAYGAHLGGFAGGAVLMLLLRPLLARTAPTPSWGPARGGIPRAGGAFPAWRAEDPYAGGRTAADRPPLQGGTAERIQAAWGAGRWEEAAKLLSDSLREDVVPPIPEGEFLRISAWLYDHAYFEEARAAFRAFLDTYPSSRNAPAAAFGLGMILSRRDGDLEGARAYLLSAARSHPDPHVRDVAAREVERIS